MSYDPTKPAPGSPDSSAEMCAGRSGGFYGAAGALLSPP